MAFLHRIRAKGLAALVIAAPLAAGCTLADSVLLMGGATLVSFIHTDKTISDHIIGAVTKKDCSTLRILTEGKPFCRDPAEAQANVANAAQVAAQTAAAGANCYRKLGRVRCYDRPNPFSYRTSDDNTAQRH